MKRVVAAVVLLVLATGARAATCPGYSTCPPLDYPAILQTDPDARADRRATAAAEAAALLAGAQQPGVEGRALALGAGILNDVTLSVRRNQACSSCHAVRAGDAGGVSIVNASSGVMPGSVVRRAGLRKPPSLAYAFFAPVLSYDAASGQFTGGTFWDMRATGLVTGYPTADQVSVPFTSPFEMAMPDPACVVYRMSQGQYAGLFSILWGAQSFAITWPADSEQVCSVPNSSSAATAVLDLSSTDRNQAMSTLHNIAFSVAQYESSAQVAAFSSRFDQGPQALTSQQQAGYALFVGKGRCVACHTASSAQAGVPALFTDFAAANVGTPRNPDLPYLTENVADAAGYVANPAGPAFVDNGFGAFLASDLDTNSQWKALAAQFIGTFQVPTLRNVAVAPRRGFVRAYAHNGYFTSLKDIVHFYNTRDVLPICPAGLQRVGDTGGGQTVGTTCWPPPEQPSNTNTSLVGNLGLSSSEEDSIVAFLGALSDGYAAP